MVLLSLLAVGMLSLSSVAIRSSRNGEAMQQARANARLGVMLAIGQLQKAAGPDQRITVPADLVDPESTRALAGVWESRDILPDSPAAEPAGSRPSQETEEADGEFIGWLASDAARAPAAKNPPGMRTGAGRATLIDIDGDTEDVAAAVLKVGTTGGVAWITMDEGVKARYDLPAIAPEAEADRFARLRHPERTGSEVVAGLEGVVPDPPLAAKLVSTAQGAFVASDRAQFGRRLLDITPWSEGLLTDVVAGGLKRDLSLAFERESLPAELAGTRLYAGTETPLAPSDPYFNQLREYYRLHATVDPDTPLEANVPPDYRPARPDRRSGTNAPAPAAANGMVLAPAVTRVNLAFSVVSREAHGQWIDTIPNRSGDPRRTYMVYLIYTPVVTLYNPYTVPISVSDLQVTFEYLPLGFQFFRNGQPQTANPALLSQFHVSSQSRSDWEDRFTATLSSAQGSGGSGQVTLSPGEARVFGVNHPPGTRWGQMTNYLWQNDLGSSKTLAIKAAAGWNYNSGFIVDWLAPTGAGRTADNANLGVFGVRGQDQIDVAFAPVIPTIGATGRPADSFTVEVQAKVGRRTKDLGIFRYRYGNRNNLLKALEGGRHPAVGQVTYPVRREKPWAVNEIYQTNVESTPVERWTGPKQFAMFTLAVRTSQDSLYPTKPGRDASFANQVMDMDITNSHPAQMPMELSFLPVTGRGANTVGSLEVFSAEDPRAFFFSGWTAQTGVLHYPSFQLPRLPMINLADFRHAHLAGSGFLTNPSHTVGESFAHPLVPADRVLEPASGLADHAWLANRALWDGFWLSGIRPAEDSEAFLNGGTLPLNPRLKPWLGGQTKDQVAAGLAGPDGWKRSAAHATLKGAFNIHSTSVEAWRAVLSSLRKRDIPILAPPAGGGAPPVAMEPQDSPTNGTALPRFLDGPAEAMGNPQVAGNQTRWGGFRELTDDEITRLAESLVERIRERGPFLSMAEFINRRPGGEAPDESLHGMLQQAIEIAGLNQDSATPGARMVTAGHAAEFGYPNPEAAEGDTESAAPAYLTQGDVLSAIGAGLAVRSDTFVIRAHGESRDTSGRVLARAVCEAVVQRVPDYVDSQDPAEAAATRAAGPDLKSPVNRRFGRRIEIVSFRWIPDEAL